MNKFTFVFVVLGVVTLVHLFLLAFLCFKLDSASGNAKAC